ncbi:MAG TPA: mechanosensitive ion channel family protein [Candidatus Binataceae bacterium]|nr:mechanosensitive ion channel family protein [Candidatus Binataceae bacterium]
MPTPLQTTLGLDALPAGLGGAIEVIAALVAIAAGFALRRRKRFFRAPGFAMLAVGFASDLIAELTHSFPLFSRVSGAIAVMTFFWALVLLMMDAVDSGWRRGREHFSTIFRDILTFALFALVVMAVLWADFGVNPFNIVIGVGAVSVVVGLALQETLGNVFSGLALQLQKPFSDGDWVKTGPYVGQVRGVGLRSTTIITRANERLDVPNTQISKEVLVNYATDAVGDEISIGISYEVPPNHAREVILRVLGDLPYVLDRPAPEVLPWEYGDFAIRYRIKFWMADFAVQERVHAELVSNLWYALRRHAIEIPFPTRTLEMRHERPERIGDAQYEREMIAALRELYFLRDLPDRELEVIAPTLRVHGFGAGELIVREGESGDTLFIIRRGEVEVLLKGAGGQERRVATLKRPQFFGEMSLLTGDPRSATIRALSDVEVLEMNREGFMRLFKERPEAADAIGEIVAARQAENVQARRPADGEEPRGRQRRWIFDKIREIFDL